MSCALSTTVSSGPRPQFSRHVFTQASFTDFFRNRPHCLHRTFLQHVLLRTHLSSLGSNLTFSTRVVDPYLRFSISISNCPHIWHTSCSFLTFYPSTTASNITLLRTQQAQIKWPYIFNICEHRVSHSTLVSLHMELVLGYRAEMKTCFPACWEERVFCGRARGGRRKRMQAVSFQCAKR